MAYDLTNPIYNDEEAARKHFEAIRWPAGVVCPHCGVVGNSVEMQGKTTRAGLYKCRDCRKPFTATVGTVYERSKIPMHKWLLATHLICASKKGISAHQLFRMLGFGSYRTAWFMAHRIREAMADVAPAPVGGNGGGVEMDETYFGDKNEITKRTKKGKASHSSKRSVVALVERKGKTRMFHVERADKETVLKIIRTHIEPKTKLYTDDSALYWDASQLVSGHSVVKHTAGEYVRGGAHTNSVEGLFGLFKRGMRGVYQHCGEQHLHRYLNEFEFRYNNREKLGCDDLARTERLLKATEGKRLTYQQVGVRAA
ncbi:MAG: IS1595 family transposase [Rhodospirillales bacterium]|nr:IS1595 family transposase [Rhodospirillales bacterium]